RDTDSPYPGILSDIQEAVTYILGCILNLVSTIGSAASWLERPPFSLLPDMTVFRQFLVANAIITNRLSQQAISTQCNQHFIEIIDYIEPMRSRVEYVLQNCNPIEMTYNFPDFTETAGVIVKPCSRIKPSADSS
ncbi:Connector enhancer of kinase suppressor of ras 2, partial [Schistosoma japonicum]